MAALPPLSALVLYKNERIKEDVEDGVYCLDSIDDIKDCKSSIIVVRNALQISPKDTDELEEFMANTDNVAISSNRFGPILRRQATFGAAYNFGQTTTTIPYPVESWPAAVKSALQATKHMASSIGLDPDLYNGVHANFYATGKAGVGAHSDKESDMVRGMPIFSFTLLPGEPKHPRNFDILRKPNAAETQSQEDDFGLRKEQRYQKALAAYDAKMKNVAQDLTPRPAPPTRSHTKFEPSNILLYSVKLNHGDLLVMQGAMQTYYLHAVAPETKKSVCKCSSTQPDGAGVPRDGHRVARVCVLLLPKNTYRHNCVRATNGTERTRVL